MHRRTAAIAMLVGSSIACASVLGVDDVTYPEDASVSREGGSPAESGTLDAGPGDAIAPDAAEARAPVPCRSPGAGAGMISAGAFCIDATEVTQAEYGAFLKAKSGDVSGQPPECAWNVTFATKGGCNPPFDPPNNGDYPVVGVDWCDAWMYCAWANKRLCGARDGGARNESTDPTAAEWYFACTDGNDGLHTHPYGTSYDPLACNGGGAGTGMLRPVRSFTKCQGGYAGIFDMEGNAWEWENGGGPTDPGTPSLDPCRIRGGSVDDTLDPGCVNVNEGQPRSATLCVVGFRCCLDQNP
jgi:formylglycine-generating enzyme required for sulfatase activity